MDEDEGSLCYYIVRHQHAPTPRLAAEHLTAVKVKNDAAETHAYKTHAYRKRTQI